MSIVLMGLGPYRFATPGMSYHEIVRNIDYRHEPQWRIGRRPAMQFLGTGVETVKIHGIVYPHYTGGFGQLNNMRSSAEAGIPLGLASSRGVYFGPWCIAAIHDEQTYFHNNGSPQRVEFDIDLMHYGGDQGGLGFF